MLIQVTCIRGTIT